MPELPDLTVFSENLTKVFKGKTLTSVRIFHGKRCDTSQVFEEKVLNKTLSEVKTIGKEMFFHFGEDVHFGVHLMLKGGTAISEELESISYKIAAFGFNDGKFVVITDPQRWAKVIVNLAKDSTPDALLGSLTLDDFKSALRRFHGKPVKAFLIDQAVMKGIGNAYADEILYDVKVDPASLCNKLPDEIIVSLHKQIPVTLQWGVNEIRKLTPDAVSGEGRAFMKVHRKDLDKTTTGFVIQQKDVAGKTSYFTAEQVYYG
ncbi:DNA-formamidopyrimidine glycosylase family protein [Xanthocytophaga flava]|uniref:DNA-formamidopyrimidine glycosylase family protein n=1 Tax=Xanthocytophaga flava TaxID=3048013 RepID=UPI0028D128DE|nr:DNA-formamidopyrimidine glycosylase family protein [Xanthocytophaga flavus]MDJ1466237.1 DNA-formamidopyrimidine glycosylase family protein [Xanthocytophaga flavus]